MHLLISQSQFYACPCCNHKQRQSHTSAWSHITWYQTPVEYFFYSPFPITTVPLILCYSRFIVNTVTGVFIKDSSGPWSVLWCYTELFVNWTTVRVPICTFTVSPSGCSEAERGGGNKIRKDEANLAELVSINANHFMIFYDIAIFALVSQLNWYITTCQTG